MLSVKTWILLVVIVVAAFGFPYLMQGRGAGPISAIQPAEDSGLSTEKTRQTYYKWQDANGSWHFGDEPPQGVALVPVSVDTAANVLRPIEVAKKEPEKTEIKSEPVSPTTNAILNPEAAAKALENAEKVQKLLNERTQQLDSMLK
ncbi:DUF4124 domain-containing protein [Oceanobacter mangrovi]|uniref:DUF4124 domain-containing protein n=1 Tax=Oceanobacter mangrovi TaxID=2862510 RepID=UPI001C8ECA3B|nr:DUF4124 domain-containing protein [Oceanobacter mangrovi]